MSVLQFGYILYTHRLANRIRSEKNIAVAPAASKKCHSFIKSLCLVYVLGDFFYRTAIVDLHFFGISCFSITLSRSHICIYREVKTLFDFGSLLPMNSSMIRKIQPCGHPKGDAVDTGKTL